MKDRWLTTESGPNDWDSVDPVAIGDYVPPESLTLSLDGYLDEDHRKSRVDHDRVRAIAGEAWFRTFWACRPSWIRRLAAEIVLASAKAEGRAARATLQSRADSARVPPTTSLATAAPGGEG